jgi:hypothetical protein
VKGFLSFSPLVFTLVPKDMTIEVARTLFLEIPLGFVLTNFIAYFHEKRLGLLLGCGRFSPTEI